jgi:hypothetical protein
VQPGVPTLALIVVLGVALVFFIAWLATGSPY